MKSLLLLAVLAVSVAAEAAPHGIYPYIRQQGPLVPPTRVARPSQAGKLQYFGGPVLSHVKIYAVFWGTTVDKNTVKGIGDFFTAATNSSYFDWLKEYNTTVHSVTGRAGTNQEIGRGSFGGNITIQPGHRSNHLDDTDIQAELDDQITAGNLPKPDADTLYMNYFPPGVTITIDGQSSCSAFCAYHEGFVSKTNGNIFYGVMPDLGGMCMLGCGFHGKFNNETIVSSHEMIEATTDPFPCAGNKPDFPQAWNAVDGNEIGDLCVSTEANLTTQGLTYDLQKEFDNATNSCASGPYQSP